MSRNPTEIITHDGPFHADDVFACAAIDLLEGEYCNITRTRKPHMFAGADYLVDVGGEWDHLRNRFDHHQFRRGEFRRAGAKGVDYAAFGMVWLARGEALVKRLQPDVAAESASLPNGLRTSVEELVEHRLVVHVDASDTGETQEGFSISKAIAGFNPGWAEQSPSEFHHAFTRAMNFAKEVIRTQISQAAAEIFSIGQLIQIYEQHMVGVQKFYSGDRSDMEILCLPNYLPWERALKTLDPSQRIKFVVFPSSDGMWCAQCVPPKDGPRTAQLVPFPAEWATKTNAALAGVSGVPSAHFCHAGRFLVKAHSQTGALELARRALQKGGAVHA